MLGWSKRNPFLGRCSGQIVFGKIGAIVGRSLIGADQGDWPGIALVAQRLRGSVTGGSTTHDYHRGWAVRMRRWRRRPLRSHIDFSLHLLDVPASERAQGRRARHLASSQRETSVVQRTTDLPVGDHALS